jgi:hypothetical protein
MHIRIDKLFFFLPFLFELAISPAMVEPLGFVLLAFVDRDWRVITLLPPYVVNEFSLDTTRRC